MSEEHTVINFQHVERMKLTNETTVYVQFASGTTRIFEFIEPTLPAKMIVAFENWLDQRHQYGGYVVKIGQDGKASGKPRSEDGYVGALDAVEEYIADLEASAEKAEAMVEKLIEAGRMMKQPETIEEFHRGRRDYNALVAKWKEQK